MPRYALAVEFDGRAFNGTQVQAPNLRTVQGVLSQAAATLAGISQVVSGDSAPLVRPASRLDAEVSAAWLPCDVDLERAWAPAALAGALGGHLPPDVSVIAAAAVPDRFHAQHDAVAKTYGFSVIVRAARPTLDARAWWVRRMDFPEKLDELAAAIIGRRDLSGFAGLRHDGTDEDDPVRTVHAAAWTHEPIAHGLRLTFTITGDGFLYKQIRGLVGAMVFVAQGRRTVADFHAAIHAGRDAVRVGNIAPPTGLVLARVTYDPEPEWESPP
jgi:tRNA pseudouridine38-40 synthase